MKLSTALAQIHFTRKKKKHQKLFGNTKNHEALYTLALRTLVSSYMGPLLLAIAVGHNTYAKRIDFCGAECSFAASDLVSEL